jgi:hypothetical protein
MMRRCRYHGCRREFSPPKPTYYYCCWEHRVADVGEHYEKRPYDRQSHGDTYDRGFWAGARVRPGTVEIPHGIWALYQHLNHEPQTSRKQLKEKEL